MDAGQYTWTVNAATLREMKNALNTVRFLSPEFMIGGLTWRLDTYPNGNAHERSGSFDLFLELMRMPCSWKYIEIWYKMRCQQTHSSYAWYQKYDRENEPLSFGWPIHTMLFSEIQDQESLSFIIDAQINRVMLLSDAIFFDRGISMNVHSMRSIQWKVSDECLRAIKCAHNGKEFTSEILDEMWCLCIHRKDTHLAVYICMRVLPMGQQQFSASCTLEAVMIGENTRNVSKILTHDFSCESSGHGFSNFVAVDDIMGQCVLSAHIAPKYQSAAIRHQYGNMVEQAGEGIIDATNQDSAAIMSAIQSLSAKVDELKSQLRSESGRMEQIINEIHKLKKELPDAIATKHAIASVIKCFSPHRNDQSLSVYYRKCQELRQVVEEQYPADSVTAVAEVNEDYMSAIKDYIVSNQPNDDLVRYKVSNHPRVPSLNGGYGVKAKVSIGACTVIGEYSGKYCIEQHLETLAGTQLYNKINQYAFSCCAVATLPVQHIKYYESTDIVEEESDEETEDEDIDIRMVDSNHNRREPPRKKHKKNEVEHTFNIVLDGYSVEPNLKSILVYMNDCRQDIEMLNPTKSDKKFWNIELVTIHAQGWPRVFGVTTRDIEKGEELLTYYGDYSAVLKEEKKLKERNRQLMDILKPIKLDHLMNDLM